MTANDFRKIALSFADSVESAHMDHPDFRVGGKIFASLGYPDSHSGMVTLPPEEQARLCAAEPDVFIPAKGAWGRTGSTQINLKRAHKTTVHAALFAAYEQRARKNRKPKLTRQPVKKG